MERRLEMKKNYDVKINGNILINKFKVVNYVSSIIFKLISIVLILGGFFGEIGKFSDNMYLNESLEISRIVRVLFIISFFIYFMMLLTKLMFTKKAKISIIEILAGCFIIMSFLNYVVYFQETNDKKVVYLLIIYLVIWTLNISVDILTKYYFWKEIYTEGIKLYGDNFKEYHEININYGKELTDREKLDICINEMSFGKSSIIIDLIKLQMKNKNIKRINN
jgi:hypothetical protein